MAKQSGLHQIRGKVGEHSYYNQTGVASGLIRSINQGMSERVKTGEEYANVRLNNAEFGQAGRIAKVLGMFITPKYRPMLLPFSQSKMCKILLESIKQNTDDPWGERNIPDDDTGVTVVCNALNFVRKNDPESYGVSISILDDNLVVSIDDVRFPDKLSSIGADGYNIRVVAASPWIGYFHSGAYADSFARGNNYDLSQIDTPQSVNVDYEFRPAPPQGWPAFLLQFFVIIIMPYRTVNGRNFILQEHCTYFASEVPESE